MVNSRHDPHQTYKDLQLHHSDLRFRIGSVWRIKQRGSFSRLCCSGPGNSSAQPDFDDPIEPGKSVIVFFENTSKFPFFLDLNGLAPRKPCVFKKNQKKNRGWFSSPFCFVFVVFFFFKKTQPPQPPRFMQSNPKKVGGTAFHRYEKYKAAKTFKEASFGQLRCDPKGFPCWGHLGGFQKYWYLQNGWFF